MLYEVITVGFYNAIGIAGFRLARAFANVAQCGDLLLAPFLVVDVFVVPRSHEESSQAGVHETRRCPSWVFRILRQAQVVEGEIGKQRFSSVCDVATGALAFTVEKGRATFLLLVRITSYNVCYTKLLRIPDSAMPGITPPPADRVS